MSQQVFAEGNRVAGAASGVAPATATTLGNYVIVNKTLGTVTGTVTGSGTTTTYSVRSQALYPGSPFEVTGNGTANFQLDFKLEPGDATFFVLNSSAAGTLLLSGTEMVHTAAGARNREFEQVFLDAIA